MCSRSWKTLSIARGRKSSSWCVKNSRATSNILWIAPYSKDMSKERWSMTPSIASTKMQMLQLSWLTTSKTAFSRWKRRCQTSRQCTRMKLKCHRHKQNGFAQYTCQSRGSHAKRDSTCRTQSVGLHRRWQTRLLVLLMNWNVSLLTWHTDLSSHCLLWEPNELTSGIRNYTRILTTLEMHRRLPRATLRLLSSWMGWQSTGRAKSNQIGRASW